MPRDDSTQHDPPAPVAEVSLRTTDNAASTSDVRLLIETGADATLLPRQAVDRLGLRPDPALRYELIRFDGTRAFADAVDLDMIFLAKAFRGRYLLTDEPCGILGRDVLASVAPSGVAHPRDITPTLAQWRQARLARSQSESRAAHPEFAEMMQAYAPLVTMI